MNDLEIERNLLANSEQLLGGLVDIRLPRTLEQHFGPLRYAFVIRHIAEQFEDIYTIVLPPSSIVIVEMPRSETEPFDVLLKTMSWNDFLKIYKIPKRDRQIFIVLEKLLKRVRDGAELGKDDGL